MDYFPLIKRCSAAVLIAAILVNCSDQQSIFTSLALINSGLDYPRTQEKLIQCRQNENESCLKVYNRVKAAKQKLFALPREQALKLTLDTVASECKKPQENLESNLACSGAITALYFFPTHQDGNSIRRFLESSTPTVLHNVVSKGSMWLDNREDKSEWREWTAKSKLSSEDQNSFLIFLDMESTENLTINHLDDSA